MHYVEPCDRNQLSLANNMNDWVSPDNVVRLIDVLVDQVVKAQPGCFANRGLQELGRKAYRPETLMKLYLYGYLNGICSSRKLERECYRNVETMWLLGLLRPDHKTISDYRKDNPEAIRQICLSFRGFLKEQGFIGGHTVAYDGTKLKANASRETVKRTGLDKQLKKLETELDKYLNQLQNNDIVEDIEEQLNTLSVDYQVEPLLLQKIAELQKQLETLQAQKEFMKSEGLDCYAPADPDARIMKSRDGYIPAYNVQAGVDKKNKMIILAEVTNRPNDKAELPANIDQTVAQTGIIPTVVEADRGYANLDGIQAIEEKYEGTQCVVPLEKSPQEIKDQAADLAFTYDPTNDCYICSEGRELPLLTRNKKKRGELYNVYQGSCAGCPRKSSCTTSKRGRTIHRNVNKPWIDQYKQRLTQPAIKKKILERKTVAEHPFGTLKYLLGKIPLRLRGMGKVQIEVDIITTAYDLKRLISLESMENLLFRVQNHSWVPR